MFDMQSGRTVAASELSWSEASKILRPLNPELTDIIDEISPSSDYKLYKAKYRFGTKIIDKGRYFLPLADGGTISFNDNQLPKTLVNNLSYDYISENPLGIVLNNKAELFLSLEKRIFPYDMLSPGKIFGLSRFLDLYDIDLEDSHSLSHFMWDLTAGGRSLFLLPKVTENMRHNKFKKTYKLTSPAPQFYDDQWSVFRDIADKEQSSWSQEILYFSNKWYQSLNDNSWAKLYNYFLRVNRKANMFWQNNLGWQTLFSSIEQEKNLKFSSYTLDTTKHLFAMATGAFPGFKPAVDESAAPIKLIQDAYVNGYGLTDSWPIIMELGKFSIEDKIPIYYSLNHPTLLQHNPQSFKGKSLISLLKEVQYVLGRYQSSIAEDFLGDILALDKSAIITEFSYYHSDTVGYPGIKDNILIPKEDNRFVYNHPGEFPKYSTFLKGCIKLSVEDR